MATQRTYISYSALGEATGMTVAEVKVALRRKKYLIGHAPSEKALAARIAIWREADTPDGDFPRLRATYPVWHAVRVIRMFKRSGLAQNPAFLTANRKQARKNYTALIVCLGRQMGAPSRCNVGEAVDLLAQRLSDRSASVVWFDAWHHNMGFNFLLEDMMSGVTPSTALRSRLGGLFSDVSREANGNLEHLGTAEKILDGIEAFVMRRRKRLGL